jgi:hypothetical protein
MTVDRVGENLGWAGSINGGTGLSREWEEQTHKVSSITLRFYDNQEAAQTPSSALN